MTVFSFYTMGRSHNQLITALTTREDVGMELPEGASLLILEYDTKEAQGEEAANGFSLPGSGDRLEIRTRTPPSKD